MPVRCGTSAPGWANFHAVPIGQSVASTTCNAIVTVADSGGQISRSLEQNMPQKSDGAVGAKTIRPAASVISYGGGTKLRHCMALG